MGIDVPALKFLLDSRMRVGAFGSTLMIGRQGLHFFPELLDHASDLVRLTGLATSLNELTRGEAYGETLLENLGSSPVDVMDNDF